MPTELEVIKIVLQLGAFGVLAWLVYQQNTKTIPQILERFDAIIRANNEDHNREVAQIRADNQHQIDQIVATQEKIRERIHGLAGELQHVLTQLEIYKEKAR